MTVRIVFDTNVFVRAMAGVDPDLEAYKRMERECHSTAFSDSLIDEYCQVLGREMGYSQLYFWHEYNKLLSIEKVVHANPQRLKSMKASIDLSVKGKDLKVVQCAGACGCSYIVSGDHDLLELREIKLELAPKSVLNIKVLHPKDFVHEEIKDSTTNRKFPFHASHL